MAKIIENDIELQSTTLTYSLWRVIIVGLVLGLIYCGLIALLNSFINSISICGDVSTIVIATLGIIIMVRLNMAQPLIIAVATSTSLWGLANWTNGLGIFEVIIWSMFLYSLSYTLFSWIARFTKVVPVLLSIAIIITILRVIVTL